MPRRRRDCEPQCALNAGCASKDLPRDNAGKALVLLDCGHRLCARCAERDQVHGYVACPVPECADEGLETQVNLHRVYALLQGGSQLELGAVAVDEEEEEVVDSGGSSRSVSSTVDESDAGSVSSAERNESTSSLNSSEREEERFRDESGGRGEAKKGLENDFHRHFEEAGDAVGVQPVSVRAGSGSAPGTPPGRGGEDYHAREFTRAGGEESEDDDGGWTDVANGFGRPFRRNSRRQADDDSSPPAASAHSDREFQRFTGPQSRRRDQHASVGSSSLSEASDENYLSPPSRSASDDSRRLTFSHLSHSELMDPGPEPLLDSMMGESIYYNASDGTDFAAAIEADRFSSRSGSAGSTDDATQEDNDKEHLLFCSGACGRLSVPRDEFSKTQLKLAREKRRCLYCIAGRAPPSTYGAESDSDNEYSPRSLSQSELGSRSQSPVRSVASVELPVVGVEICERDLVVSKSNSTTPLLMPDDEAALPQASSSPVVHDGIRVPGRRKADDCHTVETEVLDTVDFRTSSRSPSPPPIISSGKLEDSGSEASSTVISTRTRDEPVSISALQIVQSSNDASLASSAENDHLDEFADSPKSIPINSDIADFDDVFLGSSAEGLDFATVPSRSSLIDSSRLSRPSKSSRQSTIDTGPSVSNSLQEEESPVNGKRVVAPANAQWAFDALGQFAQNKATKVSQVFDGILPFTHSQSMCKEEIRRYFQQTLNLLPQDFFLNLDIHDPIPCFLPCISFVVDTTTRYSGVVTFEDPDNPQGGRWVETVEGEFKSNYDNMVECLVRKVHKVIGPDHASAEFDPDLAKQLLSLVAFSSHAKRILPVNGLVAVKNEPAAVAVAAQPPAAIRAHDGQFEEDARAQPLDNVLPVELSVEEAFTAATAPGGGESKIKTDERTKAMQRLKQARPKQRFGGHSEFREGPRMSHFSPGSENGSFVGVDRLSVRTEQLRRHEVVLLPVFATAYTYHTTQETWRVLVSGNKGVVAINGRPHGVGQYVGTLMGTASSMYQWVRDNALIGRH